MAAGEVSAAVHTDYVDWRDRAACLGANTEMFFPVGDGAGSRLQVAEAKEICHTCPVIQRCAEVAITHGYEGVWGGLDDRERRLLRRDRNLGPHAEQHHPSSISR